MLKQGGWGQTLGRVLRGWGRVGGGRKVLEGRCHLRIAALEGPSWAPSPPQDVDSRDRRRRELGRPEQQEPREQPEPSTSWWPVSSAEKKKNITLVRTGHMCCSQTGGSLAEDAGGWGAHGASGWGACQRCDDQIPGASWRDRSCHACGAAAAATASPTLTRCSFQSRALIYSQLVTQESILLAFT